MSQTLTVRDLLGGNVQEFDPLNIDLSEIRAFSAMIPTNGQLDINTCEVLATKALRMGDMCSELLSVGTCYVSKMETERKRCYSHAALVKATAAGIKTDKSRAWFSESDPDYIAASNKYSEGLAFVKLISSKYDSAIRLHYACKEQLKRFYAHEGASGFNPSTEKVMEHESNPNSWGAEESSEEEQKEDGFGKNW